MLLGIGLDKNGYLVNSFLISRQKHKKNIDTVWLKKVPYYELWPWNQSEGLHCWPFSHFFSDTLPFS